MRYTVLWRISAEQELAEVWNTSDNRSGVTTAADEIDRLLRDDPTFRGETNTQSTRVLILPPLAVTFQVAEDDRVVWVLAITQLPDDKISE